MAKDNQLEYKLIEGNHIFEPMNKVSKIAQELTFEFFEQIQRDYINSYHTLNKEDKYRISNNIGNFFTECFLNNDGTTFRRIVGYNHKGLMTNEELKNIIRDYDIAINKKKKGEFKSFLLLDLLIYSNRKADAVIINNNYELELYDFSEGVVADKIKRYSSIEQCSTESERKQFLRKQKQNERIISYKNNIDNDDDIIKNIIIDNKRLNIRYKTLVASFYDFNYGYKMFLKYNRKRIYIPNSLCFIMKKEDLNNIFISRPLRVNIDSPVFITKSRPLIEKKYIDDIYKENTFIGISLYYLLIFINEFTCFEIKFSKKMDLNLKKQQVSIKKNNKTKFIYLRDTRTSKWLPLTYGLLEKHMFMNFDLKTWIKYISSLFDYKDNEVDDKDIINYEKLHDSIFNFFII